MKKTILLAASLATLLNAQTLQTTVEEVLTTNPVIIERLKNYNATKEDITGAQSGYYPQLNISVGLGYEDLEDTNVKGTPDEDYDSDIYESSLRYTQNLFNGFDTVYKVQQQEFRTTSSAYSYIEKVNDTSFQMVNTYIKVMKNKELLHTAKENVDINEKIFIKVQKLYDSGLTTLSEVNKIESSLALARANYVVQENTLLDVSYNMHKVLGRYLDQDKMQRPVFSTELPVNLEEASQFAIKNNPSLLVSDYNLKLSQASYKGAKSSFYPKFDIEVSQAFNKNNIRTDEIKTDKFRAMATLSYNIFNGFSDSSNLQKTRSKIHQEVETKNELRRQVLEGLNLSWAANEKLTVQLGHLEDYKRYSLKTLTLYAKEYDLGRRSLLDLLSAQNDFIGAKSQIINTEYDMLFAKYRILDAMGTLVLALTSDTETIYSNVGLNGKTPENQDTLPVRLDLDNDLIVNEKDICSNSLSTQMKGIYGCESLFANTQKIERYTNFLFVDNSSDLTSEGEDRLNNLIEQIKEYGFEHIRFDVLGNVDDEDMKKEDRYTLSASRAEAVENKLIEAGVSKDHITVYAQGDEAPLYTTEKDEGIELNNRVDIVVRKLKI